MIGRILGGLYKVVRRIGEGGMGTVYMAVHVHLNKGFAIKILSENIGVSTNAVNRLLQEAQTASSIDHENIVDVVSFDTTDDGRVFLVMELLEGSSLADVLDQGALPLGRAMRIAFQISQALGEAHERGIVHRDLKPENVFLLQKKPDFVKVLDFGISKVKTAEAENVRMTRTGQLVGTPLYMSPEQARGETDVDHRADIYALGVIVYEMLTGRPPFQGKNYFQLLWKHGNEVPPRPTSFCPELPAQIEDVLMRSLEKSPEDRFSSMHEFEEALRVASENFIARESSGEVVLLPRTQRRNVRWSTWMLGLSFILALMLGGYLAFSEHEPPITTDSAEVEVEPTPRSEQQEPTPSEDRAREESTSVPLQTKGRISFRSRPEGASVLIGEIKICDTPCEAELPFGESTKAIYRLRGYRDAEVEFTPEESSVIWGVLRRRIRVSSSMDDELPSIRMTL